MVWRSRNESFDRGRFDGVLGGLNTSNSGFGFTHNANQPGLNGFDQIAVVDDGLRGMQGTLNSCRCIFCNDICNRVIEDGELGSMSALFGDFIGPNDMAGHKLDIKLHTLTLNVLKHQVPKITIGGGSANCLAFPVHIYVN
jgi:hypothetical protein